MRAVGRSVALGLAGYAAYAAPAVALTMPGNRVFPAVLRVDARDRVALTFDDGPDTSTTRFLTALERASARATFFVTGEQVERAPARVAEIVAAGHEVGVHGFHHRLHSRRTPWETLDDLRRARAVVEDAAGRPTALFRPPYGVFNLASWREADRQGWARVLWSRWGRDWSEGATTESIVRRVGWPLAGEIVLLHDSDRYATPGSWRRTLAALPEICDRLAASGLRSVTVSELLANGAPIRPPLVGHERGRKLMTEGRD